MFPIEIEDLDINSPFTEKIKWNQLMNNKTNPKSEGREWMYHTYIYDVEKYIIDSVNNKGCLNDTL